MGTKKKEASLGKRFGLNFAAYGYNQVVSLALQFVLVPFFLRSWGADRYGEWLIITGVPMMLTLLDMGVAQASASRATMKASSGNWGQIKIILNTCLGFSAAMGAIISVAFISLGYALDWRPILNLSIAGKNEVSSTLACMGGYLSIQFLGGVADAHFRTIGKFAIGSFLLANRRMVDLVITIVVLCCGFGMKTLALSMLVGQIVAIVGIFAVVIKMSPTPLVGIREFNFAELRFILKPGLAYMGFPIAQTLSLSAGVQLLNQLTNPATVVTFTMCRTLVRILMQFTVVANHSLRPELSRLAGEGNFQEIKKFTNNVFYKLLPIVILGYVTMVAAGPYVVKIWSHGKVEVSSIIIAAVGAHAVLNALWFIKAAAKIAQNSHSATALMYSASAILGLLIWLSVSRWMNPIYGASLALAFPEIVMTIFENSRASWSKAKDLRSA